MSGHEEEGESGAPRGGGEVGCLHVAELTQVEEGAEVRRAGGHGGGIDTAKHLSGPGQPSPTLVGWRCSKMFSLRVATALLAFRSCLYICVVGGMDGATAAFR